MKTLTIKQPYAELIARGIKRAEIRTWRTNYRGQLLIRAGLGVEKADLSRYKKVIDIDNMKKGKIVAKCNLVDCVLIDQTFIAEYNKKYGNNGYYIRDYNFGNYAWVLADIEPLNINKEVKGMLGLWNYKGVIK